MNTKAAPASHRCPLCGGPNGCAQAASEEPRTPSCWCFTATLDKTVLARIPPEKRGNSCICQACATTENGPFLSYPERE